MNVYVIATAIALVTALTAWVFSYKVLNKIFSKKKLAEAPTTVPVVKNRTERRAEQFASETKEDLLKRQHRKQIADYEAFVQVVTRLQESGKIHKWSAFTFAKNLLRELERAILKYNNEANDVNAIDDYVTTYQWILMKLVAQTLLEYTESKGLQAVTTDLIHVLEKYYRLHGLMGVLYRHKGHIHYNDRCEGMSAAILRYFSGHVPYSALSCAVFPIDYCTDNESRTPVDHFRRNFFHEAVDVMYNSHMKQIEKNNYAAAARKDQQEFEKNRRQRSKRLARGNRKPR